MNGAERAFAEHGFAVVRNVVSRDEVSVMREEIEKMITGAPVDRSTSTDRDGNPVGHPQDFSYGQGRNGSPVLNRISNQLARSCVMREVYANPKLLSLVEDIYGPEFVPFAESIVIIVIHQWSISKEIFLEVVHCGIGLVLWICC